MNLPIFQSQGNQPFMLMQTKWASVLNPIIGLPMNSPSFLKDVTLTTGTNAINHLLGRIPQGWFIVDQNAAIDVYRSAAFNDLTLTLTSSGAATVSLIVF